MSKITPEFEDAVKKWVSLDNKIKQVNQQAKEWKKEKEKVDVFMIQYMNTNGLENSEINLTDGKLKLAVSQRTAPMNKQYMLERLTQYFKSATKAQECLDFIYADREKSESYVIRRTTNRNN